jgi:hypothetical protein
MIDSVVVIYKLSPFTIGSLFYKHLFLSDLTGSISIHCVLFVWSVLGDLLVLVEFVI